MKTIEINEKVLDLVPEEFKSLPDVEYRLTKVENTRTNGYVYTGDSVRGDLTIVDIHGIGKPGVAVRGRGFNNYIRTSPIVEVLDVTDTSIVFRTEGGTYLLNKLE